VSTSPTEGEHYFLRVLLNHIPGATSWRHLRTVNGVHYHSICDVACAAGLIEEDDTLDDCLTGSSMFQMPSSLHRLFATILVF
jgi:ATP-dependent DNA helicase PIF1